MDTNRRTIVVVALSASLALFTLACGLIGQATTAPTATPVTIFSGPEVPTLEASPVATSAGSIWHVETTYQNVFDFTYDPSLWRVEPEKTEGNTLKLSE